LPSEASYLHSCAPVDSSRRNPATPICDPVFFLLPFPTGQRPLQQSFRCLILQPSGLFFPYLGLSSSFYFPSAAPPRRNISPCSTHLPSLPLPHGLPSSATPLPPPKTPWFSQLSIFPRRPAIFPSPAQKRVLCPFFASTAFLLAP